MIKYGFRQSSSDSCVFTLEREGTYSIAAFWVDDSFVASSDATQLQRLIRHIGDTFKITTRELEQFIGLNISRNRNKGRLTLSQPTYLKRLLDRFNMGECSPKSIPADPSSILTNSMSPATAEEEDDMKNVPYPEAVGALLWASLTTRPEIAYAVGQTSKFLHNPGRAHWNAVKGVMAYIKGTIDYGIVFKEKTQSSMDTATRISQDVRTLGVPHRDHFSNSTDPSDGAADVKEL